ncbi:ferritin family protein [Geoalkalibacter halelectricus]|uniref:Rubrerythrin n=1 Tax=Geoalkalibacter halelectricus TaxID=2847045 RepID=A0ABY5ZM63_9BACT|nr:ferritin family protein [Geoalkalibacter halelectricus]MDO3379000.1 rubrerythrin [Geoalkalibacter halelectricus]UWZ78814.1 rubrerythrin [Geoalkalibacter halelectricus]
MPDFGHPFSCLKNDRMVTHAELVRAIRFMVAAEYEAIQLYMQLAESTDNTLAQQVLVDIANEERVHAGEFLRLLKELDPEEEMFYQQGAEEVETEFLGGAGGQTPQGPANAPAPSASATGLGIGSLKQMTSAK